MALNTATDLYLPVYNFLARPITVFPVASKPGMPPYTARGIPSTQEIDVAAEDGSVISDQRTICDIREDEFAILPKQFDRISIPASASGPAWGDFEVMDVSTNGGGETTLTLRRWMDEKP